jgi:uroporphyrinogen-III synthase
MAAGRQPRVLVTRSKQQSSELAGKLRELDLDPVLVPAIEFAAPSSFEALDAALARLAEFQWVIFTSANAAEAMQSRLKANGVDAAEVFAAGKSPRVAAIGPATARALAAIGLRVDLMPAQAVAESLLDSLLTYARQVDRSPARFLLIRAEDARDLLPDALRAAGAEVVIAPAYRTVVPAGSIEIIRSLFGDAQGLAAITFTSSSTARNLLALCDAAGVKLPGSVLRISIGPITSETMRSLSYPPHAEALDASVVSLAQAVRAAIDERHD